MTDYFHAPEHSAIKTSWGGRDLRLDAFRGLALWCICIDHIPDNALSWFTLRNYGFSDTSEVFFFVSGYTCMLAYGGMLREQGWPAIVARALRRASEIYAAFLLLLIAYIALIWALGAGTRYLDETNTRFFFENPGEAIFHSVLLQYAPVNTDVLPTFVLLHSLFPVLLWVLIANDRLALAISIFLYLMVQVFSWHAPAWPSGELYFNPLAFQLLFVLGAWFSEKGEHALRPMLQSRIAFLAALSYVAFSLFITLGWHFKVLQQFVPDAISNLIYPIYKSHLAPVRLMHFLSLALLMYRVKPSQWYRVPKPLLMAAVRCGENSLAIYCLGVLLSFAGLVVLTDFSNQMLMQAVLSVASIVVMIFAASLLTLESQLDRRGPKLF